MDSLDLQLQQLFRQVKGTASAPASSGAAPLPKRRKPCRPPRAQVHHALDLDFLREREDRDSTIDQEFDSHRARRWIERVADADRTLTDGLPTEALLDKDGFIRPDVDLLDPVIRDVLQLDAALGEEDLPYHLRRELGLIVEA